MEPRQPCCAYLLRMWQVCQDDRPVWRSLLRSVATGETHGFPDLESLFLFLREQAHSAADPLHGAQDGDSVARAR